MREFSPLEIATHDYVIKQAMEVNELSSDMRNLIHNAFVNGACWAVNNPVLVFDLEQPPLILLPPPTIEV